MPWTSSEADHEGERAGVAEAVGHPQALEGVAEQPPAPGAQRAPGVVTGQLPGLGDELRGAHDGTGTHT